MIEHTPPQNFPAYHFTGVAVPSDFAKVIIDAADKSGVLFEDQLLTWAMAGAECARTHQSKTPHQRRTRK